MNRKTDSRRVKPPQHREKSVNMHQKNTAGNGLDHKNGHGTQKTIKKRDLSGSTIKEGDLKSVTKRVQDMNLHTENDAEEENVSLDSLMDKPAPYFRGEAIIHEDFEDVSLDQYAGKYLVLLFYPMDFSYICPSDIIAFSSRLDDFQACNCEIVAVSTDSSHSHLHWTQTPRKRGGVGKVRFPLLSDKTQLISKKYGVYIKEKGYSMRATFIIDTKGVIRHIMIYGIPIGRSVNETLRVVRANQYVDEEGEAGCQSEWQPGRTGVVFSVEGSQQFFKTQQ
ncbi:hypothetical protein FSP39_014022 [Pinctada imbricata]|uniref:thioredoxin-dependent peroxiredoxin n=1 Tax=Pinctada imbricata TaxID=66713 RepID=A0AA89CCR5_PINIB|nr:hypothetical protein FSP39_014022 [Pinctada imbricata]